MRLAILERTHRTIRQHFDWMPKGIWLTKIATRSRKASQEFDRIVEGFESGANHDSSWQKVGARLGPIFDFVEESNASPITASRFCAEMLVAYRAWQSIHGNLSEQQFAWLEESSSNHAKDLIGVVVELNQFVPESVTSNFVTKVIGQRTASEDPFESLLALINPPARKKDGVFFTPVSVADELVSGTRELLISNYGLAQGFVDQRSLSHVAPGAKAPPEIRAQPFIRVFEPAMGSGTLVAALIRRSFSDWQTYNESRQGWSEFVAGSWLHRIYGNEINPISFLLAHLNLAKTLEATDFDFDQISNIRFHLRDTLNQLNTIEPESSNSLLPTLIIGNPPFGALTTRPDNRQGSIDYMTVDGSRIRERKTWLHDVYVQFVKLCHEQIDHIGSGVIGLITNRGYLDNVTFRGMRFALHNSFDEIRIAEIHSGVRNRNPKPQTENPFGIASGVAISLFCKHSHNGSPKKVVYKTAESDPQVTEPDPPFYFFVPKSGERHLEYEQGIALPQAMPFFGSSVITARDWLVTDTDRGRLENRIQNFADKRVSDDHIRESWFHRTRSSRYPAGDSRSWKLADARTELMRDLQWKNRIELCQYRPLDKYFVFWADYMIDWPRRKITHQLRRGNNIAIVTRRQAPAELPYNFFWLTDLLVIDGILRSDNRGNESVFPLKIFDHDDNFRFNFSDQFCSLVRRRWRLDEQTSRDLENPTDWFAYIYALFSSNDYRTRYRHQLQVDFPRVLISRDLGLAKSLVKFGRELISIYNLPRSVNRQIKPPQLSADNVVVKDPKFDDGRIWINRNQCLEDVSQSVWDCRVGAHQVVRKWLKNRKAERLNDHQMVELLQIVQAIEQLVGCTRRIDRAIQQAGSWKSLFAA